MSTADLLGRDLDAMERELLEIYERVKALAAREDLPPCVERNVKQALVALWNAALDQDLQYESLLDSHGI